MRSVRSGNYALQTRQRKRLSNKRHDDRRRKEKPWRQLYNSVRWTYFRGMALARDLRLCQRCLANGRYTPANIVHHIKPHRGDEALFFDADNVVSSCKPCHDAVEQGIEARGYDKSIGDDGFPIDPTHPFNR